MDNRNNNDEFSQMQEQIAMLKSRLEKQNIVNDKLLKSSMKSRLGSLAKGYMIMTILAIFWIPMIWHIFGRLGYSVYFLIATSILMLVVAIRCLLDRNKVRNLWNMDTDLVGCNTKLLNFRRSQFVWLKYAIPVVVLWLGWIYVEMFYFISIGADKEFVTAFGIGVGCGALLGGLLGYSKFKKDISKVDVVLHEMEMLKNS